jgi:hypothetical protein
MTDSVPSTLESVTLEIEQFVALAGWDRGPMLFALVPTALLAAADAGAASLLGIVGDADTISGEALTPIAQEELPDGPLDEVLAGIGWSPEVHGCALAQEILMLPPDAEADVAEADNAVQIAAEHPQRREARLVVAVLRDGTSAALLRVRALDGADKDLVTGPNLAPNLVLALAATLQQ